MTDPRLPTSLMPPLVPSRVAVFDALGALVVLDSVVADGAACMVCVTFWLDDDDDTVEMFGIDAVVCDPGAVDAVPVYV